MFSLDTVTEKKQNGDNLSQSEIEFIINGYTAGTISDDEMTIWLKTVFDHGMNHEETLNYTQSMLNSGIILDFSHLPGFVIDKHSTGGVGDKVSMGDVLLGIKSSKESPSEKPIPKDTESIIKQAES